MDDPALEALNLEREPTPADLGALDARCFSQAGGAGEGRAWDAGAYTALLSSPHVFARLLRDEADGALGLLCFQRLEGEAELYRIGVVPEARRRGWGGRLMAALLAELRGAGVDTVHLEVREGNMGARALYRAWGFEESGRRSGYYTAGDGTCEDAVLYSLALTP